jgi:pimeloyl-ACP methyl ester carboxylesterase
MARAATMKELRFRANGLTLNCLDYGGAGLAPLLFIHGGSAHAHWWDFVAPAFTGSFHVLALDQRGHGDSESPKEWGYGSRHYVSDLAEVIGNWDFGAPVLVGHSMGGHNVLVFATQHSAMLRAMVAIDSPPSYSELAINYLRTFAERRGRRFASLEEAIANFKVLPRETLASKEILEHVARHSYQRLADGQWTHKLDRRTLSREPIDVRATLPQVACPALVIKAARSPVVDAAVARQMAAELPNGRLAVLDNSLHHVPLDNPAGLVAMLQQFFAEL